MALNGDARRLPELWHGKPPMHSSFDSWINKNGKDAYKHFVRDHPKTDLSYEAWRQTDRVYGGYLFYVASLVWAEDDDSDEESVKRRRISRVQSDSRKIATTNGNGASRTAGSATPTRATNSDESNAPGKRKRKPRKKYMSQELVASDEEATEEVDVATPPTETETPTKSEVNANGRRKSNSRKPRKKPISDETISPEDEDNDAVEVDAMFIDSPLPVRSVPRTSAPVRIPASPKKGTPQQASVKKSRKSFLVRLPFHLWDAVNLEDKSEEMVLDEDTKNGNASIAEVSRPATTPAPRSKPESSNDIKADKDIDEASKALMAEGTPDAANTRRGLRDRKPAQQRPYFHDAQVFEEVETEHEDESDLESLSRAHSLEPSQSKPKHFKGKGRAWKKDDSDEDEEFVTPKEKKAARAAKAKAEREKARAEREANENGAEGDITSALMHILEANQTELGEHIGQANGSSKDSAKHKKTKKPRKSSLLSENLGFGNDASQATSTQPPKRGRGRPRKSALSSEIVRDDSDDEAGVPAQAGEKVDTIRPRVATTSPKSKPSSRPSTATSTAPASTPRKRGRPRKSENIATPAKASAKASKNAEEAEQRHSPTATKATQQKRNVVPSSVKTTYPAQVPTPGEALLDRIWPMYHKSVVFSTPSPPADAASSQPAAPVPEPAHDASTAGAPPAQIEAAASASTTATGVTATADASMEEDKAHAAAAAVAPTSNPTPTAAAAPSILSSASPPSHTQTATGPAKREQEDVNINVNGNFNGNDNEDDGDTRSIAMSLGSSSDTQL